MAPPAICSISTHPITVPEVWAAWWVQSIRLYVMAPHLQGQSARRPWPGGALFRWVRIWYCLWVGFGRLRPTESAFPGLPANGSASGHRSPGGAVRFPVAIAPFSGSIELTGVTQ